jgi:predicted membrane protein
MKKNDFKYIIAFMIFLAIIILIFKFIAWLLPYALVLLGVYLVYVFIIKVKDRSIELSNKEDKNNNKNKDIKEAEIVKEKNN